LIRKPVGVPDDSQDDRAARRLEEFQRAREPQGEGTGDEAETDKTNETAETAEADETDDAAPEEETDTSEAASDPEASPDPPEGRPTEP
jgi:hypothetical protein